jgi:hypothetical protein
MMKQLWEHIQLDFQQLDEVAARKEARRRGRLTSSMIYLKEQGVIRHSLVHASEGDMVERRDVADVPVALGVSLRFNSFLGLGSTFAQKEVLDRVARLLPDAEGIEVTTISEYVLSQRNLVHLFKLLGLEALVAFPAKELKSDVRAAMLLSILGELQLFSRQPRSRNVSDPATADLLVLNVLATHVMDNVMSELTHFVLQKVVNEGTPVWEVYQEQLASEKRNLATVAPPTLSSAPTLQPLASGSMCDDCTSATALGATKSGSSTLSRKFLLSDMVRAGSLDITVPNSQHKNSAYAPCQPRLGKKR